MSTAAAHFAGLPELVDCVAHHVFYSRNICVLDNMRLVNRTFNAAATPYRFSEPRIRQSIAETRSTGKPGLNPLLVHVRHAFFTSFSGLPDEEEPLQHISSQMPRLESIRCNGIPLTPALLRTLTQSCPRLQSLEIGVQEYGFASESRQDSEYRLDLDGFRDLRELTLHSLPADDYGWWIPQLVRLLRDSPRLKRLALGFNRLPSLSDAPPLRTLSSLKKLTDLTYLDDVYISNALPPWSTSADRWDRELEVLEAFAPPHAPNLRRFQVDCYSKPVHEHLCRISDPSFTRNLAISYRRQHSARTGFDPAALFRPCPEHPRLPLKVRMIDLDLHRAKIRHHNGREISISADQVLDDLVSTSVDSLEGLAVRIPGVLASAKDQASRYMTRAAEQEMDAEPYLQTLERALARLPKLTQLSVKWDGPGDKATGERLALAGPSLRFIHIYMRLWRVWRNDDGTVRLETVKNREADRVELWRYSFFVDSPLNRWHLRQ